jgi:hypothetical protein
MDSGQAEVRKRNKFWRRFNRSTVSGKQRVNTDLTLVDAMDKQYRTHDGSEAVVIATNQDSSDDCLHMSEHKQDEKEWTNENVKPLNRTASRIPQ